MKLRVTGLSVTPSLLHKYTCAKWDRERDTQRKEKTTHCPAALDICVQKCIAEKSKILPCDTKKRKILLYHYHKKRSNILVFISFLFYGTFTLKSYAPFFHNPILAVVNQPLLDVQHSQRDHVGCPCLRQLDYC